MPAIIDATGIQIPTSAETLANFLNGTGGLPGMYAIYGPGINVNPNSPDGQMLNILALAITDAYQFLAQIYDSFDPNQAVGVQLDQRCAINGVIRQAGTNTQVNVLVTVTQALTLTGLDAAPSPAFTVADTAGNQYVLQNSHVFSGAGSASLAFQAVALGPVAALANTLTTAVTVQLGVASVNNPAGPTSLGVAEETDSALRLRRAQSTALPSQSFVDGIIAGVLNVPDVTGVKVQNNNTTGTVGGTPANSIWVVVAGGVNAAIAQVIYSKMSAGCGMRGSVTVDITQLDGNTFAVNFDRPTAENLYISFSVTAINGSPTPDPHYISTQLQALLAYQIGQSASISAISALVEQISPGCAVTLTSTDGVSPDGSTWTQTLNPTSANNYQFAVAGARIRINGTYNP